MKADLIRSLHIKGEIYTKVACNIHEFERALTIIVNRNISPHFLRSFIKDHTYYNVARVIPQDSGKFTRMVKPIWQD